ncbi:MAG: carboxypeptidase-like regulatory domain-containing protein [Bryobacteraceae bacterium]|nr:carboxypeptidase-like regulatory domain-containing protein [Bryobacteraceae bacterium]
MLGWTLFSLTIAQSLTPPPPVPAPRTAIQGRVLDSNTGLGIPRANVTLKALDGKATPSLWMRTSNTGDFAFDNLAPGLYSASAERNGYSGTVSSNLNIGHERRIFLEKDQNVTGFLIRLAPHSVISGKVLDDNDDPVAFAAVHALRCIMTTFDPVCETASVGITNDLGEYRLAYLAPGKYLVRAESSAFREGLTPATAVGSDADSQVVSTYFPQTPDPALAIPLDVAPGKQVGGIEIRLERTPVFTVRGRVNPLSSQTVVEFTSSWFGKAQNPYRQSAITDREGRFALKLPAGPYLVTATAKNADRPLEHRSRLRVKGELDNFVVTLAPQAGAQGMVTWPESGPSANLRVDLRPLPGQLLTSSPTGTYDRLNSLRIENIPAGEYSVRISGLPPSRYLKRITVGGVESGTALIEPGSRVTIDVEVAEPAASLEGIAVNRLGQPTAAAQVLIWRPGTAPRLVLADGHGEWRLAGLPPGDYRALAVESLESDLDATWLLRQEPIAEKIELKEGNRAARLLLTQPAPPVN